MSEPTEENIDQEAREQAYFDLRAKGFSDVGDVIAHRPELADYTSLARILELTIDTCADCGLPLITLVYDDLKGNRMSHAMSPDEAVDLSLSMIFEAQRIKQIVANAQRIVAEQGEGMNPN